MAEDTFEEGRREFELEQRVVPFPRRNFSVRNDYYCRRHPRTDEIALQTEGIPWTGARSNWSCADIWKREDVIVRPAPNSDIYVSDGSHDGYIPISLASLSEHLADELKPEASKK